MSFNLSAKAGTCGTLYYTAKVDKVTKAAFVSPLEGVIRISMLYIQPKNSTMWSLIEVWNNTMSRRVSPHHCCFIIHDGNTFGGYGDLFYQYFIYERHGQASASCSNPQLIASERPNTTTGKPSRGMVIPDIKELEDVITPVKLLNISEGVFCALGDLFIMTAYFF